MITPTIGYTRHIQKRLSAWPDFSSRWEVVEEFTEYRKKIKLRCIRHNQLVSTRPSTFEDGGNLCPQCLAEYRFLKFQEKARIIWGEKYTYLESIGNHFKARCNIHNVEFTQAKANHLFGKAEACPFCYTRRVNFSIEDYITESKKIWGDGRWGYEKLHFEKGNFSKTKITLWCNKHHTYFTTKGMQHLLKSGGCPSCNKETLKEGIASHFQDPQTIAKELTNFLTKARDVWGDKIDYSHSQWTNCKAHIQFRCVEHDEVFKQTPRNHLAGKLGCRTCYKRQLRKSSHMKKTTEEFVQDAVRMHGQRFDYNKVDYQGTNVKIEIICKEHGSFWQSPIMHISKNKGGGCPRCRMSGGEGKVADYLEQHNLVYIYDKPMEGCLSPLSGKPLRYDFYIPSLNLVVEFHGEQHYFEVSSTHWGDRLTLTHRKLLDAHKAEFLAQKQIKLLVIPYHQRHRVDRVLDKYFVRNEDQISA